MSLTDAHEVTLIADRSAIGRLLSGYFRALDSKRLDTAWAEATFTADAELNFPPDRVAEGRAAVLELTRQIASWWKATLHLTTDHLVETDGDTASLHANLSVTHIHFDDDPRPEVTNFVLGGVCDLACVRTPRGWRIARFTLREVWSLGDPPAVVLKDGH
ncbi:nuclear transport factor 2 family protein [Streptomyces sp. NPDC057137]|uniref:nuclear transport factor 2 family protein n=1 Tax=Streptomyces sp. NPDC057137 TaxID=3346030 RepID=UPI0036277CDE